MAIPRRPTIVDDDGTMTAGTVLNRAFFEQVFDYIEALADVSKLAASKAVVAQEQAQAAATAATRAVRGISLGGVPKD